MATIKKFEEIEVWKLARELSKRIFKISGKGAFSKDYKLKDQINSASGSSMDNIAEGFGRASRNEFVNFLSISNGSASEVKSQLFRAFDREYITETEFKELSELCDLLIGKTGSLIQYLNKTAIGGQKFKNRTDLKR